MFDVDSRQILIAVEPDVYVLSIFLDALPGMADIVRQDETLNRLHKEMTKRTYELYPNPENESDIEKMLVCGFGPVV